MYLARRLCGGEEEQQTGQQAETELDTVLDPTDLDRELAARADPKPRLRKALPLGPCFVPWFVQVGQFWVPRG
jgi:hypothetical protein